MNGSTAILRPWIILILAAVLVVAQAALLPSLGSQPAAPSADYRLSWWTADGGGVTTPNSAGGYALVGTIGQPDAGALEGTGYSVDGGFWQAWSLAADYRLYLPVVLRDSP